MSGIPWLTLLLPVAGVLIVLILAVWFVRSYTRGSQNERGRQAAQNKDIASYIRSIKTKDQEAWTDVMTVMGEDRDLSSAYMQSIQVSKERQSPPSSPSGNSRPSASASYSDPDSKQGVQAPLPLSDLQQAFFGFWRIPANKIPGNNEEANRFIEAYKAKLRADGYTHRVRRWGRLEILIGRFCAAYNVKLLNQKCKTVGIDKPVLDVLLAQVMHLLGKEVLQWKDVANESAYLMAVKQLERNYPQLALTSYKRDKY